MRRPVVAIALCAVLVAFASGGAPGFLPRKPIPAADAATAGWVRFAVIGDYGSAGQAEQDVADLVKRWNVDFVVTTGDNNYDSGAAATIDDNIGRDYHGFIAPYAGRYGAGSPTGNRFFPVLGNHDWVDPGAAAYLDYFTLPGNERYYDVVRGPVHLFAVDSDPHEPDGISPGSVQGRWLRARLTASTAAWKLVFMHHPPYSSGSSHGSATAMQWPFAAWGATAVLAGHEHHYERIGRDGILYFVNGLGGKSLYPFGAPVVGSAARYNGDYGAMLVDAADAALTFRFVSRNGALVDSVTLAHPQSR